MTQKRTSDNVKASKLSVVAWIIYDTGNTAFFTGVMGLVFPLWITTDLIGGNDATVGYTLSVAMAIIFLISPILGTMSDQSGKRMAFLTFFTLISVIATFFIGLGSIPMSLALFATAVIAIHTADIFYNTILEDVSSTSNIGTIAGIGIGLGYIGAIIAVVIGLLFIETHGHVFVMRTISIVMLVLMSPLLFIWKDKHGPNLLQDLSIKQLIYSSALKLILAAQKVRSDHIWARFLLARFWYMWAVNAAASFAVLYGVKTVGLPEKEVQVIFLLGIVAGIPSGALWGVLVDRYNPAAILKISVIGMLLLLTITALIPILSLPSGLWALIGIMSGISLAGIYVAERPLIIQISPRDRIGEYFGLNSMSGRLAAIAGPFSWGMISVTLGMGQIAAVIWLIGCVALSSILLYGLKIVIPKGAIK